MKVFIGMFCIFLITSLIYWIVGFYCGAQRMLEDIKTGYTLIKKPLPGGKCLKYKTHKKIYVKKGK
jgi:hypothetical protein